LGGDRTQEKEELISEGNLLSIASAEAAVVFYLSIFPLISLGEKAKVQIDNAE
jgi:hypothetical protein